MTLLTLGLLLISTFIILFPSPASAVCPVCTVAVGAGLGISRALGIDDAVTSVWIGGLILSMSYWTIDYLTKKKYKSLEKIKPFTLEVVVIALMYILVLVPLWYGKYIGRPLNSIYGIDKILFGTIIGSVAFYFGKWLDEKERKVKGKILFPYQKVVFPVSLLILSSLILHFIV